MPGYSAAAAQGGKRVVQTLAAGNRRETLQIFARGIAWQGWELCGCNVGGILSTGLMPLKFGVQNRFLSGFGPGRQAGGNRLSKGDYQQVRASGHVMGMPLEKGYFCPAQDRYPHKGGLPLLGAGFLF